MAESEDGMNIEWNVNGEDRGYILLDETKRTLNRQLEEIRTQRNHALRMLRGQFAVAGLLFAALTTIFTQSLQFSLPIEVIGGNISGPLIVIVGALLLIRGIVGFFRGIYSALNVLSSAPVSSIPYSKMIILLFKIIREGTTDPLTTHRLPSITANPSDIRDLLSSGNHDQIEELVRVHLKCIEDNNEIIEDNERSLFKLYRKIAWGTTGFTFGAVVLFTGMLIIS